MTESRGTSRKPMFAVADFTATGLRDHCVNAVLCVDSAQFSDPPLAFLRECRRVLAAATR